VEKLDDPIPDEIKLEDPSKDFNLKVKKVEFCSIKGIELVFYYESNDTDCGCNIGVLYIKRTDGYFLGLDVQFGRRDQIGEILVILATVKKL